MEKSEQKSISLDRPALYEIKVGGRLNEKWSDYFEGMTITVEPHDDAATITSLRGVVTDQSTLFGLLKQIRDLGLPLLLVERVAGE
jgi:hypothetical protein